MSTITPSSSSTPPVDRHALTPVERQRSQLEKLLKDPEKPAYVPAPPKEKTIRPPREMMKNVQGSSAGAGSGEFHVYKASRRREYERLKLLEEETLKETIAAEFERKQREAEEIANSKTAKNRAKRQKKKERSKTKTGEKNPSKAGGDDHDNAPIKKRRLVNGKELLFKAPGEGSDDSEDEDGPAPPEAADVASASQPKEEVSVQAVVDVPRIIIHEDD